MRAVLAFIALGFMLVGQSGIALAMPMPMHAHAGTAHHLQAEADNTGMPCCAPSGMHACASPGGVLGCLPSACVASVAVAHDSVLPAVVRMPEAPPLTLPDKPPKA